MDKEKLQEIGRKLLKRADLVTIGLLIGLLLAAGWLFLKERNAVLEQPQLSAAGEWDRKIPSDLYNAIRDGYLVAEENIQEDPQVRRIVQVNMFDIRSVRSQAELQKELDTEYQDAEALYVSKDYDGALKKLTGILERNPEHTRSLELKQKIEVEKTGKPAEAAAPAGGEANTAGTPAPAP